MRSFSALFPLSMRLVKYPGQRGGMKLRHAIVIVLLFTVFNLAGCAARPAPYSYEPEADEIKKGPGLFSGEKGQFTIYRKPADTAGKENTAEPKEKK